MIHSNHQQLSPQNLEQVWNALKEGFCPFQTMPGISVSLYGDRDTGIRYEVWENYPGPGLPPSTTTWLCPPEECHKILPTIWKAYKGYKRTGLNTIVDKYFKKI